MSDPSLLHHVSGVLRDHVPDLEIVDSKSGIVDGELEFFALLGSQKLLIEVMDTIPYVVYQIAHTHYVRSMNYYVYIEYLMLHVSTC